MSDFQLDQPQDTTTHGYIMAGGAVRGTLTQYTIFNLSNPFLPPVGTQIECDWYATTMSPATVFTITVEGLAAGAGRIGLGDPMIAIYDSNGVLLASNDNAGPGNLNASLSFTPPTLGDYYIEVRAARDFRLTGSFDPALEPGDYVLRMTGWGEPLPRPAPGTGRGDRWGRQFDCRTAIGDLWDGRE